MRIRVESDKAKAVIKAARRIAQVIREDLAYNRDKPPGERRQTVIGFATGGTQEAVYTELVRMHLKEGLDFSNVVSFNLDEYEGVGPDDDRSYAYYMWKHLFSKVNISEENINLLDGRITDPDTQRKHIEAYEAKIKALGGIRLQLLGIGSDGHWAFNERPKEGKKLKRDSRTRRIKLREGTREDNAVHCGGLDRVPTHAITMGLGTILEAEELLMVATGDAKNQVMHEVFSPENADIPAALTWEHPNACVIMDVEAAEGIIASSGLGWMEIENPRKPFKVKLAEFAQFFAPHHHGAGAADTSVTGDVLIENVTSIGLQSNEAITGQAALIKNGNLYLGSAVDLRKKMKRGTPIIEAANGEELFMVPGFFDRHVHGCCGDDFLDGTPKAIHAITEKLAQDGTTHCMATLISSTDEKVEAAVRAIAAHVAKHQTSTEPLTQVVGIHLEGPFISHVCRGAHSAELLKRPNIAWLQKMMALAPDLAWSITIAPELAGAIDFIKQARRLGVKVFIGHTSAATADVVREAEAAGAAGYTHLPNAMGEAAQYQETPVGFSDLKSPVVQHALTQKSLPVETIMDFIHSTPAFAEFLLQSLTPEKIMLITDSTSISGLPDGEHKLGLLPVIKEGAKVTSTENNKLAGSGVTMEECVANFSSLLASRPLSAAEFTYHIARVTSQNAHQASVPDTSTADLKPQENFVIVNRQGQVRGIVCNGRWIRQDFSSTLSERTQSTLTSTDAILASVQAHPADELSAADVIKLFQFENGHSTLFAAWEEALSPQQQIALAELQEQITRCVHAAGSSSLFKAGVESQLAAIAADQSICRLTS